MSAPGADAGPLPPLGIERRPLAESLPDHGTHPGEERGKTLAVDGASKLIILRLPQFPDQNSRKCANCCRGLE